MIDEWLIWQLCDSSLPTGGFIASNGLESFVQTLYPDSSIYAFYKSSIQSTAMLNIPVITSIYSDIDSIHQIEDIHFASLVSNHVALRASKAQGVALINLLLKSFQSKISSKNLDLLESLKYEIRKERFEGLFTVCFAVMGLVLNIHLDKILDLFMYFHIRSLVSSTVRLNIMGPYAGQDLLARLHPITDLMIRRYRNTSIYDTASCSPLVDILQGVHDNLYSRIFNS